MTAQEPKRRLLSKQFSGTPESISRRQDFGSDDDKNVENDAMEEGSDEDYQLAGEQLEEAVMASYDESGDSDDMQYDNSEEDEVDEAAEPVKKLKNDPTAEDKRKSRDEQKKLLKERKANKPNAAMMHELKKLWETIRQKSIDSKVRWSHMETLMSRITGKIKEITLKHDAARIVQCALKYGNQQQRDTIAEELKGSFTALAASKYGRYIVSKVLNFCPAYRAGVISEFYGHVKKLMRHKDAAFVVEEAYSQFANASQKVALIEEFYGPEFTIFKSGSAKPLSSILAENPEKRPLILKHLRESLSTFLEKDNINIGPHTIVHRALLDYLSAVEPKVASDMVELLKDHLISILHTREGARVAQIVILLASPKDRKHILKTFKGYVSKVAREQYGHTVLLTIFDAVDDTVLVSKSIIAELIKPPAVATDASEFIGPESLLRDRFASRVALYILCGRSRRYQPVFVIEELEQGDSLKALNSKKDDVQRRKELLKSVSTAYIELATRHCDQLVRSRYGCDVLFEIFMVAEGDKGNLIDEIAKLAEGKPTDISLSDSDDVSGTKKEPFNAAKKLSADAQVARRALGTFSNGKGSEEVIDLSVHVLLTRPSTQVIKKLVTGGFVPKFASDPIYSQMPSQCVSLRRKVAETIAPNLEFWIRRCASDPLRNSALGFLLNALMGSDNSVEDDGRKILEEAMRNLGGGMFLKDVLSVIKDARATSVPIRDAEKRVGTAKKRKRSSDTVVDADSADTSPSGIEFFLKNFS